jgi:hypothetical protein
VIPTTTKTSPGIATIEDLIGVAERWTRTRFAVADSSEFVLGYQRFEMCEVGFRRIAVAADSPEASCPLEAMAGVSTPTVWSHSTVVTVLCDSDAGTLDFEQEMAEILAVDGDSVLAKAAAVIRIPGLGVFLGPFDVPE